MKIRSPFFQMLVAALAVLSSRAQSQDSEEKIPLTSYPQNTDLWLGTYGGSIVVAPKHELRTKRAGQLRWQVADGAKVEKGDLIAIFDVDSLEISRGKLRLAEGKHQSRRDELIRADIDQAQAIEVQIADLELNLANLALDAEDRELIGEELVAKAEKERGKLRARLDRLRSDLDVGKRQRALELDLEGLEIDLRSKRVEFEKQERNLSLYAEFAGTIEIFIEDGVVSNSDTVGELTQTGFAEMILPVVDPAVQSVPTEQLKVEVHRPDGGRYPAVFKEKQSSQAGRNGGQSYIFELQPQNGEPVPVTLDGTHMSTITRTFEQPIYAVPKSPFLFKYTAKIQELGWQGFIRDYFGATARIVYVGPRDLAIIDTTK